MRVLLTICLLAIGLTAGLAVGAPTSVPLSQTSCWDCHAPGLWDPPMAEPKVTEYRFVPDGDAWWLEADVRNTWTHEMRNVSALLDASGHEGVAVLPVGNATTQTFQGAFEASLMPAYRFATHQLAVPMGTQALQVELRSSGMFAHDLDLQVFTPGSDEPCPGVHDGGAGGPDRVVFTAEDLAGAGWGAWELRVVAPQGWEVPERVDYRIDVQITTEPSGSALAWGGDARPGQTLTLRWPVELPADDRARLGLRVLYTSYYDHEAGEPDAVFTEHMAGVEVATIRGAPEFTQLPQDAQETEDERIPAAPLALAAGLLAVCVVHRRRTLGNPPTTATGS